MATTWAINPVPTDGRYSSRGGLGFVPTMLAGLVLWLRADIGLVQSAGTVVSWTDQSPSGIVFNSAPTGSTMPGYSAHGGPNSLPCLTFGGPATPQSLTNTANPLSSGNPTTFLTLQSATAAQNPAYVVAQGNNCLMSLCIADRDVRSNGNDLNNGLVTTNWETWAQQSSGVNQLIRWNGGNEVDAAGGATLVQTGGTGIGDFPVKQHPFQGSIFEVIFYNRGLSAQEIQLVEAYSRLTTGLW